MGFSKKYLIYWALVIAAAVLADWMNLFEKYEIEGASFIYGLLLGAAAFLASDTKAKRNFFYAGVHWTSRGNDSRHGIR